MSNFDLKEIEYKNKLVDNAIFVLKQEFVGIDEQIDDVMANIRTWFLYPQFQYRPVIVNLWGLTGIGKTSLVRRIAQLLDIEKDLVYFNFASISEMNSWEVEDNIEEELSNEKSNRMFVYDEFQYAATLDGHGEEKDNRAGLKPFWELLDTGIIHKRLQYWYVRDLTKVVSYMIKINMKEPMVINNGIWVNQDECLTHFSSWDIAQFNQVFNINQTQQRGGKVVKEITSNSENCYNLSDLPKSDVNESVKPNVSDIEDRFFIKENILNNIIDLFKKSKSSLIDKFEIYHNFCEMTTEELIDAISEVLTISAKGYDLKFNDSIIFVLGNLDEAYDMALNVDPDMSPDQFNKLTKKITTVDIKTALQKRFRNEQIARLGNIHIIYPSFSSDSFRKIIDINLKTYQDDVKEKTGYVIYFDKTIKDVIFDESVFPTHGTRPVFSTIHEIVKTKLPHIIQNICDDGDSQNVCSIGYYYHRGYMLIKTYTKENNLLKTYKFTIKLRLNKLRKSSKDEEQAITALHESGHFVIYCKYYHKLPEKVVSKTTSNNTGGFLLPELDDNNHNSYTDLKNFIRVGLGGYVAEEMFFGFDNKTNGAVSDLKRVTEMASMMVRKYGMFSKHPFSTTNSKSPEVMYLINEDNQQYINDEIKKIIKDCYEDVKNTFENNEWKEMLKKSSQYLSIHSSLTKKKMKELYDIVSVDTKGDDINDMFYRSKIQNM